MPGADPSKVSEKAISRGISQAFAMKGGYRGHASLIEKKDGRYMLDTTEILEAVYLAKNAHPLPDIAASAQHALARGLCEMAIKAAKDKKIDVIGFFRRRGV